MDGRDRYTVSWWAPKRGGAPFGVRERWRWAIADSLLVQAVLLHPFNIIHSLSQTFICTLTEIVILSSTLATNHVSQTTNLHRSWSFFDTCNKSCIRTTNMYNLLHVSKRARRMGPPATPLENSQRCMLVAQIFQSPSLARLAACRNRLHFLCHHFVSQPLQTMQPIIQSFNCLIPNHYYSALQESICCPSNICKQRLIPPSFDISFLFPQSPKVPSPGWPIIPSRSYYMVQRFHNFAHLMFVASLGILKFTNLGDFNCKERIFIVLLTDHRFWRMDR